jgi:hypothetical protein
MFLTSTRFFNCFPQIVTRDFGFVLLESQALVGGGWVVGWADVLNTYSTALQQVPVCLQLE